MPNAERFDGYTTTHLLSFIRQRERDAISGAGAAAASRDLRWAWNVLDERMSTGGELPDQWQIGRPGRDEAQAHPQTSRRTDHG